MLTNKIRSLTLALILMGFGTAPTQADIAAPEKPVVILSVDGGGVRGMVPVTMIMKMEEQVGPITEVVDLFAGTSAGSIVVGFLTIPNQQGKQKFTAAEGIKLSENAIKNVFQKTTFRTLRTLGGLAGSKYSAKPLEKFLAQYLGDMKLSDTVKPVLITSVDLKTKEFFNFSTRVAKEWPSMFNLPTRLAIRASTAAPTYFKPLEITLASGAKVTLTDGGLAAMSPELLALAEARALYPNRKYIMISLSTGRYQGKERIAAKGIFAGSLPKMLKPLIDTTLETQLKLSNMLMELEQKKGDVEYYRIDVAVDKAGSSLDNVSAKNIQYLQKVGIEAAEKNPIFTKMINRLKEIQKNASQSQQQNILPKQNIGGVKSSNEYAQIPQRQQSITQTQKNTSMSVPMQRNRAASVR